MSTARAPRHAARALGAAIAAALGVGGARAAAQPAAEPIRITFTAAPGCPDHDAFAGEVWARTARARPAAEGEPARMFRVDVSAAGGGFRGRLAIEDPAGATAVREVSGVSCAEVTSALALVTALAIDPRASTAAKVPSLESPSPARPEPANPRAPLEPANPPPAPSPTPWSLPARPPPTPEGVVRRTLAPSSMIPEPLPVWLPPVVAEPSRWRFGLGAHAAAVFAVAPSTIPGAFLFTDAARLGAGAFAPAARAGLYLTEVGSSRNAGGSATFRWISGHLDLCPIRVELPPLAAAPCAVVEVGALKAIGAGDLSSTTVVRPWAAAGLLGRAELSLFEGLSLEAQGALTFPFIRDTFYLEPVFTVHEVPAVGGSLSGGLLVELQ